VKRVVVAALLLAACRGCHRTGTPGDSVHEPVTPKRVLDQQRVREALARSSKWMAQFPSSELRFDAAIALTAVSDRFADAQLDAAASHAREVARRDDDNPMRVMFDADAGAPASATSTWEVPDAGRVNVNRVVAEAANCGRNSLRPEVLDYISGPMRDHGGYQSTHALWALDLARDGNCLSLAEFNRRAGPLVAELRGAQPASPGTSSQDLDLDSERALMLELAGVRDDQLTGWLQALLDVQSNDGAWGSLGDAGAEPPYYRFHATMIASWALAESLN
jgi:hypothetical protein